MNKTLKIFTRPISQFLQWRWDFGFILNSPESIVRGDKLDIRWVDLKFDDRWFADPFILDYDDDTIYVLCEEMLDKWLKGRIALMEIDRRSFKLRDWKLVLELENHLSFPVVIRKDGVVYVCPENSESNLLACYRFDRERKELVFESVVSDMGLVDAIPLKLNEKEFMFATEEPDSCGNVLNVYEKKAEKYVLTDTITLKDKHARMAGNFFYANGKLYRPGQDCNNTYGGSVILDEFGFEYGKWYCHFVRKIESCHPVLNSGLHTFNHYKGLTIIDVKGFKYPRLVRFLKRFVR